ncbi:UDP-N-acetylmuramoyl-L-alanyl-D-glutamate--2,6-diaminopimelate ligase [Kineococcus indalonis]|uniref:UDP-N-acetylmuramoyl-L-alanyl-D-glutamate--2, 6-diaminopimelate ligase n=1 Tax=Kineococcus indalonis TaxID=2696566 RepID=UPI001411F3C9|nr:UDP-N-acetylmuramoyl-L-alanyl-D-glutamate--2,6-diaminopimelate ligase [Kineococcus indalonis]NAZ87658.1 UDP-N-acetylmuramoyl-L-alanyl-D-glutamate--2,6-diaminopimelate ligase [Kineococcus indalonis]
MHLADLALALGVPAPAGPGPRLSGLTLDSRCVLPGDLYAALPGARHHGAGFARQARAAGAVAAVSDRPLEGLPTLVVPDPRAVLGQLAAHLHGHPAAALEVLGVTGTNGKTSTTHLLDAGLRAAGRCTGLLSGVQVRTPGWSRPAQRTTPEAPELQEVLASLREQGATAAAVEVSSHGLALHRVDGTRFAGAVFTNLGLDHLDLHGDQESYFEAKAALFDAARCALAVVNADDAHGRRLAAAVRTPVVTFSAAGRPGADWRAAEVVADASGTVFRLLGPGTDRRVRLRLLGAHQVDNALGAIALLHARGVDVEAAVRGAEELAGVPGRLERVDAGQPFLALVDHAHNVAGQHRVLPFLRSLTGGRVVVVLGATGERDPGKRAPLGRTAARLADVVVVTDESPHGDDPALLREAVAAGARGAGGADVHVEADRDRALQLAVSLAAPGDVVVVAGRGHDRRLVAGGRTRTFDDAVQLRAALAHLPAAGGR